MPPEELAHAIRVVVAGDTLLAPSITRRLAEEFVRRPPPGRRPTVLGETTVKTHVTRILGKLHLRDRVQAAVLAYESGLVQPRAEM